MTSETAIIALKSCVGLAFLWLFIFRFWRDYRLDSFRENVFAMRDQLFIYAAQAGVGFDDPAYALLRDRMNSLLRYAHEFTFIRLVLAVGFSSGENAEVIALKKAMALLPGETRQKLDEFNTRLVVAIVEYTILRSFFFFLFIRPIKVIVEYKTFLTKHFFFPRIESGVARLESEAQEEDAARRGKRRPLAVGA